MLFKEKLKVAIGFVKKLEEAEKYDVDDLDEDDVPKKIGVYLWRSKEDDDIVYIGQALGREGLHQRIIQQHLNKNYYGKGKEKSRFRRKVADEYKNLKREDVIHFIKKNYTLSFIEFPKEDKRLADFVEKLLLFKYELNIPHTNPDTK